MVFPGKRYSFVISLLIVIGIGIILFFRVPEQKKLFADTRFFMDTTVTIKVISDKKTAEAAVEQAFQTMESWAEKLDRFNPDGLIWKINQHDSGIRVDSTLINLLKTAQHYATLSDGAFDPTIAPLVDLWGFGQEKQRVPTQVEINQVLPKIDYQKIKLSQNQVILPENMTLDLGGIAKGFIVDQGIEVLQSHNLNSAYINAGGNIRVIGNKAPGRPWQIGIRKPRQPGEVYQDYILQLNHGSLATSGDYERFFTVAGVRYSHLLDPRTGYPAREMQAATIYTSNGLQADVLSTAVFILGWDKGRKLIEGLDGVEGFLVRENELWFSQGFAKYLD